MPDNISEDIYLLKSSTAYEEKYENLSEYFHVISSWSTEYTDPTIKKEISFKLGEITYNLIYKCSQSYQYKDDNYDVYEILNSPDNLVYLNKNGSIRKIGFKFDKIEIDDDSIINDLILGIKSKIEKIVPLSKYDAVWSSESVNANIKDIQQYRSTYSFMLYKNINGCVGDSISVSVDLYTGYIFDLSIKANETLSPFTIDKDAEKNILEFIIEKIYSINNQKVHSFDFCDYSPNFEIYTFNGEIHILYWIQTYQELNGQPYFDALYAIGIPISVLI